MTDMALYLEGLNAGRAGEIPTCVVEGIPLSMMCHNTLHRGRPLLSGVLYVYNTL